MCLNQHKVLAPLYYHTPIYEFKYFGCQNDWNKSLQTCRENKGHKCVLNMSYTATLTRGKRLDVFSFPLQMKPNLHPSFDNNNNICMICIPVYRSNS